MTVVTIQPDPTAGVDTYIVSTATTQNNGTNPTLNCGNSSGTVFRAHLLFDFSTIPAGAIIQSAILTLVQFQTTGSATIAVHRALTQWFEGNQFGGSLPGGVNGSTWALRNNNGSVAWAGGAGGASGSDWASSATASTSVGGAGSYTFDITTDVAAWVSGTASNFGLWLLGNEVSTTLVKSFRSSDYTTTTSERPKVVVTYTLPAGGLIYYGEFSGGFLD